MRPGKLSLLTVSLTLLALQIIKAVIIQSFRWISGLRKRWL